MNTPRSKKPKRYKTTLIETPGGMYQNGIQNHGLQRVIGLIITQWPHMEEKMVGFFGDLIGVADEGSARLIFRSIINQNTRLDIMRAVLQRSPLHKDSSASLDEIVDEFASLNVLRNKYAHSLWYTHEDGRRVFIEEETSAYHQFLAKREVTTAELLSVVQRMAGLFNKLKRHTQIATLARALATSPRTPLQQSSGENRW